MQGFSISNRCNKADEAWRGKKSQSHVIKISLPLLCVLFPVAMVTAFFVGRATREFLLERYSRELQTPYVVKNLSETAQERGSFPSPANNNNGKRDPHLSVDSTSKIFDTARSYNSGDSVIGSDSLDKNLWEEFEFVVTQGSKDDQQCETMKQTNSNNLPAGQQILADIRNVNGDLLSSKERLAHAMLEIARQTGLTKLSYHCHSLQPFGIRCVGVFSEGHMTFRSWPDHGAILLDIFTTGSNSLLPIVPVIQRVFGVPKTPTLLDGKINSPTMVWAHKLRGFRPDSGSDALSSDLGMFYLGVLELEMKEKIASVETEFQSLDIYDFIEPRFSSVESYQRSLSNDGSYEAMHPELHLPNRILFLDGVMQSQRTGEAEYHEALVHPALFTHVNPKRVAITGGGEGATLREVLKHNTIEEVVMIEIDEKMVEFSRSFLPEWNDCSDLIGSASCCFDDPRATVYYEDALQWFKNLYSEPDTGASRFDVIIMDALDPEDDVEFAKALYSDTLFFQALHNALNDNGIFVTQVGQAPSLLDPAESLSRDWKRDTLRRQIANQGFQSIHYFEESHAGFIGIWTYLIAFKSFETRKTWFASEAEVELAMHRRSMRTRSGASPFKYFDGATMTAHQFPSKSAATVYCREEPQPTGCQRAHGFDPERPHVTTSSLEVDSRDTGKKADRGVFAKALIPKGAYIALDDTVNKVYSSPSTFALFQSLINADNYEVFAALGPLEYYMDGYGAYGEFFGGVDVTASAGIVAFENHGCNGTYNVGLASTETEMTVDLKTMPEKFHGRHSRGDAAYNPFMDRNLAGRVHDVSTALRDILPGEEVMANYLFFASNMSYWEYDVVLLREMCAGQSAGEVTEYETLPDASVES